MVHLNEFHEARGGLLHRLLAVVSAMVRRFEREALSRATARELDELSDRELADVGLHRRDVRRVAREVAHRV